jgi:hypothetical protein
MQLIWVGEVNLFSTLSLMKLKLFIGKVVTRLQLERGDVAFFIYSNNDSLKENIKHRFNVTDEAIKNMTTWTEIKIPASPANDNETEDESEVLLNRTSFLSRLNEFRNQIISEENRENNVFEVMIDMFFYSSVQTSCMYSHIHIFHIFSIYPSIFAL